jgi:DNA-binding CsgD family transcriptional regulator
MLGSGAGKSSSDNGDHLTAREKEIVKMIVSSSQI